MVLVSTSSDEQREQQAGNALAIPRPFFVAAILVNAIYWAAQVGVNLRYTGLFYFLGVDWGRFWSAARAFRVTGPASAYDLAAITRSMEPLAAYYGRGGAFGLAVHGLHVGPVPYPPIFLYLFEPFTLLSPLLGFLLWTTLSLALAAWVSWRLTAGLPQSTRWSLLVLLLVSYPLVDGLYVGQLMVLLLAALCLAYADLQRGRELRAGLWLGVLFLKPQYIAVLLLVLLYKQRWRALAGAAATGAVLALASLAVGGLAGVQGYASMILHDYPQYSGGVAIDPHDMITWRSLTLDILPAHAALPGYVLTALLSLLSLAALIPIWSGAWNPRAPRFHAQLLATLIVTELVAYHNHLHGGALLIPPVVLLLASGYDAGPLPRLAAAALLGPPFAAVLSMLLFRDLRLIGVLYVILMLTALLWLLRRRPAAELPAA